MAKLTTEEFIARSKTAHGDKYDYDKVVYINCKTKVLITCKTHGEFWIRAKEHYEGQGCRVCGKIKNTESVKRHYADRRPKLTNIVTPKGSRAIPVGANGMYALVDEDDYDFLAKYNWTHDGYGYAKNRELGYMHRYILSTPDGKYTDHMNHDTLDNRKINLRVCSLLENQRNKRPKNGTSKYKGVSWDKTRKKWVVGIRTNNKSLTIGSYDSEIEAAKAYDKAAKEHFGEFAYLNF